MDEIQNTDEEMALSRGYCNKNEYEKAKEETIWIADSGSSIHVKMDTYGMKNIKNMEEKEFVSVSDGHQIRVEKIGDYEGVIDEDGERKTI